MFMVEEKEESIHPFKWLIMEHFTGYILRLSPIILAFFHYDFFVTTLT